MKKNNLHKKIGVVGLIGLTMGSVAVQGINNAQTVSADEVSTEVIQSTLATSEIAEQLIQESQAIQVTQESSLEESQSTEQTVEMTVISEVQTDEEVSSDVTETTASTETEEETQETLDSTNEMIYEVAEHTLIIETARLEGATLTDAEKPKAYSYFQAAGVDITSIETIEIKGDIELINEGGAGLFNGFTALKTIKGLDKLNTKEATSLANFFKDCHALTSVDVSSFETFNVTDMKNMFESLDNLTNITLGKDFTFLADSGFEDLTAPEDTTGKWSTKDKDGQFNQVPVTSGELIKNFRTQPKASEWYIVEQLGMTVKEATIYQDEDVDPRLFIDSLTDGYGNPSSIEAQDVEIKNAKAVKTTDKGEQDITLTYESKGEMFEATTTLTVKDVTDGLSFASVPEKVSFGQLDISDADSYPASITGDLKVRDGRDDLEGASWHVQASMVTDLTNEAQDHHVLNQNIYVQTADGPALINAETSAVVYSQEESQTEETVDLTNKLTLDMKASEARTGTYSGTVLWTLANGPGNEIPDQEPLVLKRLNLTKDDNGNFTQGQAVKIESDLSHPTYSLENVTSSKTSIDNEGNLLIGLNEQVGELIVRVTSGGEVERHTVTIVPFETNDIIEQAGIDWKIMKDQDNQVLMVTNTTQGKKAFNFYSTDGNFYYDEATDTSSDLKEAMDKFYEDMIATSELSNFVGAVDLSADNSGEDYTQLSSNGLKTAFPLTLGDVAETWTTNDERKATSEDGKAIDWWLRSPLDSNFNVHYVTNQGVLEFTDVIYSYGLRPALYLDLVSDIEQ